MIFDRILFKCHPYSYAQLTLTYTDTNKFVIIIFLGILAVINTAGVVFRGRIENQDSMQWENMFKTNVLGSLRTARAFTGLLRPTRGRLIYFGAGNGGDGLVAFTASRVAVEGCADALRTELRPYGINVIALDSHGVPAESLFRSPIPYSKPKNLYLLFHEIFI